MRGLIALVLVVTILVGVAVQPVHAGGAAASVALGLASFAVFSTLVAPWYPRPAYAWYGPPVYYAPPPYYAPPYYPAPVYYSQPTVVVQPPAPKPAPAVVRYPHGRYELRGDGVSTAYQWVWIPNPPPPPSAPPSSTGQRY
jgi:hypothetical protein